MGSGKCFTERRGAGVVSLDSGLLASLVREYRVSPHKAVANGYVVQLELVLVDKLDDVRPGDEQQLCYLRCRHELAVFSL